MSKLIKIKDFLRLDQAADYLSKEFNETVNIADLYQLALEEKIKISVQLINPTTIHFTNKVSPEDAKKLIFQNRDKTLQLFESLLEVMPDSYRENDEEFVIDMINLCKNDEEWIEHNSRYTVPALNNGFVLFDESDQDCPIYRYFCAYYISLNGYNFDQHVLFTTPMNIQISGIFDLVLEGEGKLILERLYQDQLNGKPILSFNSNGLFIKHRKVYWDNSWTASAINFIEEDDEEIIYQVLTRSDDLSLSKLPANLPVDQCHLIAGGLPSDSNIVIRSSELIRFSTDLINPQPVIREGQVNQKTKNSYLKLIYSLAKYAADGLTERKSKNAEIVTQALSSKGIDMPVNDRTLREYIHEGKLLSE